MAAEAIVSTVLEQLTLIIGREVVQEVRLVTGVRKETEKLTSNFEAIQAVLFDAEQRQVKETDVNKAVGLWLDKLKDASYAMDDVLDEWNTAILKLQIEGVENAQIPKKNVRFLFSSPCFCFRQIALRHDIGVKIKELKVKLDSIAIEKDSVQKLRSLLIEDEHRSRSVFVNEVIELVELNNLKNAAVIPGVPKIREKQNVGLMVTDKMLVGACYNIPHKQMSSYNEGVLCLAFSERNTNVGLQNLYATENFRLILKTNTLEAPGWEMGWIFARSHIDLSYKTKFVATNAVIGGRVHLPVIFLIQQSAAGYVQNTGGALSVLVLSNSSLVVMGIFDFTKVLSAQIPFTSYGFDALTNNEMLSPRWMNEVASGNVTSLGLSSQSNAAAGEDSNEVEDVGLLTKFIATNAGIGWSVVIERHAILASYFNSYKYKILRQISRLRLFKPTGTALREIEIQKVTNQYNAACETSNIGDRRQELAVPFDGMNYFVDISSEMKVLGVIGDSHYKSSSLYQEDSTDLICRNQRLLDGTANCRVKTMVFFYLETAAGMYSALP
ncbi:hypothetical protein EZV62_028039 [Acer yangbiense]|uniref:Disease resistance N-terminal domain-containing protein n=1 Tax=Acer yangbiense TaxID=1000413 RepID=A0A5C7GNS5_9ROSI|nr:hypothetical protein EZV62_028039 [Acer yangbiense]